MNNYKSNSSLNLNPSLVIILIWIVSIIASLGLTVSQGLSGIILVISCVLLLLYEKQNNLIRNHASQNLALNLVSLLVSLLVNSAFRLLFALVFWIPILNFISTSMLHITMIAIALLFTLINLLGLVKAINGTPVRLPYISKIADMIEQSIGT